MLNTIRVALFIDAENASTRHLSACLEHCRQLGKLTIARCYGGPVSLKKWEKAMAAHHIEPALTPPSANKQNASDFALTMAGSDRAIPSFQAHLSISSISDLKEL